MPENSIPGLWQGKGAPRKHILGKPSSPKERADLINKYSLLPNVPLVDSGTIHLHQYAHHLNSSQIMCYNFFRPMIEGFDGTMYHPKDDLIKLLEKKVGAELEQENGDLRSKLRKYEDVISRNNLWSYFSRHRRNELDREETR